MPRGCWAVVLLLVGVSAARADYLFIQYTMAFKKDQPQGQGQQQAPQLPPGSIGTIPGIVEDDKSIRFIVQQVIQVTQPKTLPTASGAVKFTVNTKHGTTAIFNDEASGLVCKLISPVSTVKRRFENLKEKYAKQSNGERVYELAEWALNHGLVDEFAGILEEVAKTGKKTGHDSLDKAVECFTQVKESLAKRIDEKEGDSASYWKKKLQFRDRQSDHYVLLYNTALSDPPEVIRRLDALEANMKGVYYWFALKGQVLKLPEQKLVAVLLDQPDEFRLQQAIEDEPLVADSFFTPRDNVVVFSSQRLDHPSMTFSKQMQSYWQQGWDRPALLTGKKAKLAGKTPAEEAKMATLALLDKSLEDEAERASVSHDGTRQLLVGCGWQRPNVVMPAWVQFGMASVMETPKSPYFAPIEVRAPYWTGYGGPSWAYARLFKTFSAEYLRESRAEDAKQLPIKGDFDFDWKANLLLQVIQDNDFDQSHYPGPRGRIKLVEARTHSWALCYYLLKMRTSGVKAFYEQLAKMPRDLDPEPNDVMACFCRAFDIADKTGTTLDPVKFQNFANDWIGFMDTVLPPSDEIKIGVEAADPNAGGGNSGGSGTPKQG